MGWVKKILVLFACALLTCNCAEVLMEIEFDLHPIQQLPDGYTPADSINTFLQSTDMKWLRYFTNLVSGKPGAIRMRTAHMMFKDADAWAQFSQENLQKFNALFDHFWVNTRRVLWTVAPSESVVFPKTLRTEGVAAGYVYQVLYSPIPGKEKELKAEWNKLIGPFVKELETNPGFLERNHYTSNGFQGEYEELIQYDFSSMQALSLSMQGQVYINICDELEKYIDEYAVNILAPGADEALYWPAQGADKATDEL
jgi:hypothetical protein